MAGRLDDEVFDLEALERQFLETQAYVEWRLEEGAYDPRAAYELGQRFEHARRQLRKVKGLMAEAVILDA